MTFATRAARAARAAHVAPLALASLLALPCACSDDAQFTTRFASDFARGKHTVSVFGVFRDGQMSAESWETIGPKLSTPFGATCNAGYGAIVTSNQPLSAAIDDYVRANGPGDELLAQHAAAATGDLMVVFTVAGRVTPKAASSIDQSAVQSPGSSPMGAGSGKYRGMRPGGMGRTRGMQRPSSAGAAFEVSASLYSVRDKRSVGLIAMQYDGASMDEAFQRMAAKLTGAIPGSTCGGWDWKAGPDEHRIRELAEH
jgi:hypothetical protein